MANKQNALYHYLFLLLISVCLFSFMSCSVKKTITVDQTSQTVTQTEHAYHKAIIQKFEADQNIIKKHPNAAALCENAMFQELLKIGAIPMIQKTASSSFLREKDTIIVKVRLTSVRETKQNRDKMKTGHEVMTAQIRLIDASTGITIHDKYISLADQPSIKSTEDASELGKLIARHVCQVIQSK